ncbi:hypothetical protein [Aidingimonas halophila]|uniref:Uncharacterized protein n=1 Tax=Aidingimonas halophila TaxID=574349 RepID=A0A1H2RHF4_9GAMM|nr:hypothetical protein [Aidingimonas halophila]GHC19235.1 hypothetical protein GCM10008094_06500 [Aidingimonas halophila]SDW18725.1 hypothetical protein SAMN05443545_101322 [Aidingimonas halophila]
MQPHLLLSHPLFEERPFRQVLEPFGFEVIADAIEPPIDPEIDDDQAVDAYAEDSQAYIDSINFQHPEGFIEIDRGENEDGDIYSVAVRAKTTFADTLLHADPAFDQGPELTQAAFDVISERCRQVDDEGWSREHDDTHADGVLSLAASDYCFTASLQTRHGPHPHLDNHAPLTWPWDVEWWKPSPEPRRNLVKAAALILAEIERIDRAAERQGGEE